MLRRLPRVLVHTHSGRAVASSLIGHLYELAQQLPVVVLTEALPRAYAELLQDTRLFPGIESVREVRTLATSTRDLIESNRAWWTLAGNVLDEFRPDLVIAENDMAGLFDMYLLRQAQRRAIRRITIQSMGQLRAEAIRPVILAQQVYRGEDRPGVATRAWRRGVAAARKRAGHALVHYALPWIAGRETLRGGSSYVRLTGAPGMRDSELHVVQSAQQYRACVANGTPAGRLAILPHPAGRVPQRVFFPGVAAEEQTTAGARVVLLLLSNLAVGIERTTGRVIPSAARRLTRRRAVAAIADGLPGWRILLKGHPGFPDAAAVRAHIGDLPAHVVVLDPTQPVERWLPDASAVIDFSPPNTTTLATAAAAFPHLPLIAADLDGDLTGDQYADWTGIAYVQTPEALAAVLESIRDGRYRRPSSECDLPAGCPLFVDTTEAALYLLRGQDA